LDFLEYINNPVHRWHVCLGVPSGTSYWQVADSSEQNGSFKMALTKAKREIITKKVRNCIPNARIEKHEVTMIVRKAWEKSFAKVQSNKKAIAVRGWNPLTQKLE